tara:strand:+ start:277 stop:1116 length:840 start_codon:yes stop_codon:yes gene_type:complete
MSLSLPIKQTSVRSALSWLLAILVLFWLVPLYGQQPFIYPIQQLDSQQELPTYAEISQPVALDSAQLNGIHLGAYLSLQISGSKQVQLQVVKLDRYVNEDRVIGAQGRDGDRFFSLTITQGQRSLFGQLSSDDETLQLYAIANADSAQYQGWLYKPGNLVGTEQDFQNDYIILDKSSNAGAQLKPLPKIISILPMQYDEVSSQPSAEDSAEASTSGINPDNFRVTQIFASDNVLVGNTIDVNLEFENISAQSHNELYVEFFFVLENSNLVAAPLSAASS